MDRFARLGLFAALASSALVACTGDKGPIGSKGDQGVQGVPGEKGDKGDRGDPGTQGNPGVPGAKGLMWRGTWAPDATYDVDDAVEHLGSAFIATSVNTGSAPPSASWQLLAAKGDIGSQGIQGIQGPKGDTGAIGATGSVGPQGDVGPAGAQGDPGLQGPPGTSVVGLSLGLGDAHCPFGGTEFIAASGTTYACNGADGERGLQGPKGDQGDVGATGPQGDPGLPGSAGTSVASASLGSGDPRCPFGGASFTSASGTTYACNGADGSPGLAGPKGLNWRGSFDVATIYAVGDVVEDQGSSFVAVVDSIGSWPGATSDWQLAAAGGATGPAGAAGPPGDVGPAGPPGPIGPPGPPLPSVHIPPSAWATFASATLTSNCQSQGGPCIVLVAGSYAWNGGMIRTGVMLPPGSSGKTPYLNVVAAFPEGAGSMSTVVDVLERGWSATAAGTPINCPVAVVTLTGQAGATFRFRQPLVAMHCTGTGATPLQDNDYLMIELVNYQHAGGPAQRVDLLGAAITFE